MRFAPFVTALYFFSMVVGPTFAIAEGKAQPLFAIQLLHGLLGIAGTVACATRYNRLGIALVLSALLIALPVLILETWSWASSAMRPFYWAAAFAEPAAPKGRVIVGIDLMAAMFLWLMVAYARARQQAWITRGFIDVAIALTVGLTLAGPVAARLGMGYSPLSLIVWIAAGSSVALVLRHFRLLHHSPAFLPAANNGEASEESPA